MEITLTDIVVVVIFLLCSIFVIKSSFRLGYARKFSIEDSLSTLKDYCVRKNISCEEISAAVITLFAVSYYLVHILTNKGENYDDSLQGDKYRKSLTPANLDVINSIRGDYE